VLQKGRVVWEGDSARLKAELGVVQGIVGV
jgi:hypothetical protein